MLLLAIGICYYNFTGNADTILKMIRGHFSLYTVIILSHVTTDIFYARQTKELARPTEYYFQPTSNSLTQGYFLDRREDGTTILGNLDFSVPN